MVVLGREYAMTYCWHLGVPTRFNLIFSKEICGPVQQKILRLRFKILYLVLCCLRENYVSIRIIRVPIHLKDPIINVHFVLC